MSRTPAAELARVRIAWPGWRIERQPRYFIAWHRTERRHLAADTLAGLEAELIREAHHHDETSSTTTGSDPAA